MFLPPRRKLAILGAILLTMFLASLDQTVVGTALPRIITDLNGANLYAWVVTAYLLTSTITVPIYGKFSDVFGRKRSEERRVGKECRSRWSRDHCEERVDDVACQCDAVVRP